MTLRILQNGRLLPSIETTLAQDFDLHPLWQEADPKAYLAAHGHEFVGLVTSARFGADTQLIESLPNLKVISSFGVGYETIDVDAAKKRGIPIGYTPDVLNDCVADLAWGGLIDVARGMTASDRFLRRGDWLKGQFRLTTRVSGKRLGVLGLGRIGRDIAKRGLGFDMEVRYHNRKPVTDTSYAYVANAIELARWADFLVVATAGGPQTRHLVSAEVLDALGPQGYLINISRGSVIDEQALSTALAQHRIAGAALDVYEKEPVVPEALLALDNVVLLPHISSATHETRQAMGDLTVANLKSFFESGTLLTPIP
ncbi:MAG: 2-hydroxyacid dehydrogenase [Burkholderiaceae bacterium]